jgi:hypothetical protein
VLEKLEKTEARLAQTELDLNSEQNVRRTLQAEVAEVTRTLQAQVTEGKAREDALVKQQAQRPFVMVLVDADADGFLVCTFLTSHPAFSYDHSSKTNTSQRKPKEVKH